MEKLFKQWKRAYNLQQADLGTYDNGLHNYCMNTGIVNIDKLPFAIKDSEVVWMIMADGFYLDDYEESATEYGVTQNGKWAAVDDGHCSCYGWEAETQHITIYETLQDLLNADKKADVLVRYKNELCRIYPFVQKYY